MTTEVEFLNSYEKIHFAYKQIMKQLDIAIGHEEAERAKEAIKAYEEIVQQIDVTFAIPVGIPENIDAMQAEWSDACDIIQKLKCAKAELQYRLKVLHVQQAAVDTTAQAAEEDATNDEEPVAKKKSVLLENPQTYYDIQNGSGRTRTYKEIIKGLREVIATKDSGVLFDTLFQSQVKLYQIQANGVVSTIAGETSMSLVMCTVGGKWHYLNGIFFIQCAIPAYMAPSTSSAAQHQRSMIWIYPLIQNVTNCYRTNYGAFIFPDIEAATPGNAFGLILTGNVVTNNDAEPATPVNAEALADLQLFFLELLEAVLAGSVEILRQPSERAARDASEQVSRHIVGAADFIARNLVKGAEKTGELMGRSTPYIISKMTAAPADAPPVSNTLQTSVEVAKTVTSAAVGVTGWVAGKVGSASVALGRYLAPHIQTHGATLLQKGFGMDSDAANSKMEGALTIAAGAVEGFSTIYNGLESSAKILGNNLSQNSVKIIEHKYGASAGNVAAGTFETIGNAFNVSQNVNYITPKGLAKKMVKNTGKAVVIDYQKNRRHESHFVPAGSLYPDLRELK